MERRGVDSTVGQTTEKDVMNPIDTRRILIAYDGSEGARHAIETAAALLPGHRAIVFHAWSPVAVIVAGYGGMVALPPYDDDVLQVEATKVAAEGCKLAGDAGLKAQPEIAEVTYQGTWHAILDVADQYDAELIVLGARGLSAFKSMILGSVSHSVAQHARRPVLIVPPAVREEAPASEQAEHAVATA
jgi:nucleotide-binding universal stress UspA family protein